MRERSYNTTCERIINAAFDVFAEAGVFHQATIRDIAKKAGIAQATIYKYFRDKEDLANSILTKRDAEGRKEMERHVQGVKGTLNKLRKMTWFYLHFYEQNWQYGWVVYVNMPVTTWIKAPYATETLQTTNRLLRNILEEGQKAGEIRHDLDLRLASHIYFGSIRQLVTLWLLRNRSYSLTAYTDSLAEMIFEAVRIKQDQQATQFLCPFVNAQKDSILWTKTPPKSLNKRRERRRSRTTATSI